MHRLFESKTAQVTMTFRSPFLAAFCAAVLLAGCEQQPLTVTPVATEPDIVTVKLAQAADKAAAALDTISAIDQARNPATPPLEDYSNAPANLMQPVSLRWSGPIEQVTRALADRAGMRFHVKGREPPMPITVNVDSYQQPILHVLRNIGLQAGHRADLAVDPASGVIELRYAAGDQPEMHHADETK
jgi:defect-in-organelle-trafficking protein DotD